MIAQLAAALTGTIGFALLYGVPRHFYPTCGIIGMLGWGLYLLLEPLIHATFATAAATVLVAFLSRLLAVVWKCPATIFMICGLFPLIPGGGIYWTTYYLVIGEQNQALATGYGALKAAVAIVLGIVFTSILPQAFFGRAARPLCRLTGRIQAKWKAR